MQSVRSFLLSPVFLNDCIVFFGALGKGMGSLFRNQLKSEKPGVGYNAATDEWVDMIEAGIVDPTKVTRSALQNAASVSALLLTTEAVVAEQPKTDAAPAMPAQGMPGMM